MSWAVRHADPRADREIEALAGAFHRPPDGDARSLTARAGDDPHWLAVLLHVVAEELRRHPLAILGQQSRNRALQLQVVEATGDDAVEAVAGGTVKATSQAQTFSRDALLGAVAWDPAGGVVYVNGVAGVAGTSWSWSAADIRVGGIYGGSSEAFCRFGALESW